MWLSTLRQKKKPDTVIFLYVNYSSGARGIAELLIRQVWKFCRRLSVCMSVCLCPEELNFWATELGGSEHKKSEIFRSLYGLQLGESKFTGNNLEKDKNGEKNNFWPRIEMGRFKQLRIICLVGQGMSIEKKNYYGNQLNLWKKCNKNALLLFYELRRC